MRRLIAFLTLWVSASTPLWADCLLGKYKDITPVFGETGIYLSAKINGKPALLKIDTGTIHSFLYRHAAESFGLTISEFGGERIVGSGFQSVGGSSSRGSATQLDLTSHSNQFRAAIDSLQLGESKWRGSDMFLPVSEQIEDAKPGGVPVDGVLGEDYLSFFDVEIDLKSGLFALYRTEGCEKANLAHWTQDYNVTSMVGYDPHAPRIQLSGKLNGSPILMQISSGMPFTAMSTAAADLHGVSSDSPGTRPLGTVTGVQGKPTNAWLGTFSNFILDEEKISRVNIAFMRFPKPWLDDANLETSHATRLPKADDYTVTADMLLGYDFLRAHHVLISHTQRKVYFSYEGEAPFAAPKS